MTPSSCRDVSQGLSPLRRPQAVRDAEERAAAAQHAARSQAGRDVPGAEGRLVRRARRARPSASSAATDRARARLLKLVAGITQADERHGARRRPRLGADRARRRLPSGDLRPRERLHQRHHARPHASARSQERFDEIVDFAELRGVHRRAGQDLLVRHVHAARLRRRDHVDPDVLLVDEVLAVGDEAFTHKCLDKFAEFRRRGKTMLLVTHSLGLVERFCDEALWLDGGRVTGGRRSEARHRRLPDGGRAGREQTLAGGDDARRPSNRRPKRLAAGAG